MHTGHRASETPPAELMEHLADFKGLDFACDIPDYYCLQGEEVPRHLFGVASGVDSQVLGEGQTVRMNEFGALGSSRPVANIPLGVFIFAGVVLLFVCMLRYTVYGRALYAIGASPEAARLAGIRVRRYITYGFILSGLMIGLAGLIRLSQVGSQSINTGLGWELQVLTAVILGGASLSGGSGTVLGTVLALLVIGVLRNGLIQLNVQTFWIEVAQGRCCSAP